MAPTSFVHKTVPALGRSVHRLGLALNYGIDARGLEAAIERGVNYLFWTPLRTGRLMPTLRRALATRRERLVIATGPGPSYFGGSVRRGAERRLRALQVDTIDVFHLFWLGVSSAWTDATVEELVRLKEEGKVRSIAVSIHDRPRAAKLIETSPLDLYMLRYNAAHPGAEREVFPSIDRTVLGNARRPAVVAYTATSWRRLLRRPHGWSGPVMTAGDCYRFCLSNPYVDVTLTGPKTLAELEASLGAIEKGPLSTEEDEWMRKFGAAVHG
jgi:aryl-alcohol dehydrogenase-like predicted oxidoreductase